MRLCFGEYQLDSGRGIVSGPGGRVEMRRQTFRVLEVLLRHAPNLVDRDTLLDEAWGHDALSTNSVAQSISELRQALGDNARYPRYIATVHRRGYRMVCDVICKEVTGNGLTGSGTESISGTWRRSWRPLLPVLLTALVIAALLIRWPQWQDDDGKTIQFVSLSTIEGDDEIPAWLVASTPELLRHSMPPGPDLQLIPIDILGHAEQDNDKARLARSAEMLGTDLILTGQWQSKKSERLGLILTIRHADSGETAWRIEQGGPVARPDQVMIDALNQLAEVLSSKRVPISAPWLELSANLRLDFMRALGDLHAGKFEDAAQRMAGIFQEAGHPAWLAPSLARVLMQLDQAAVAMDVLEAANSRPGLILSPRHRLAIRAEMARIRHDDDELLMVLKAMHTTTPFDPELLLEWIVLELNTTRGDAIPNALARLKSLLPHTEDPRLLLLQSRLARDQGRLRDSEALALKVADMAERHRLPSLSEAATLALDLTRQARGERNLLQRAWTARRMDEAAGQMMALIAPSGGRRHHESIFATGRSLHGVYQELEMTEHSARSSFVQGLVARNQGDLQESDRLLEASKTQYLALGNVDQAVRASAFRADVLLVANRLDEAVSELDSSHQLLPVATRANQARWWLVTGKVLTWNGDQEAAREHLEHAMQLYRQAGSEDGQATTKLELLRLDMIEQQPAQDFLESSLDLAARFRELGEPRLASLALALAAESQLLQELHDQAGELLREARLTLAAAPIVPIELELDWLEIWTDKPDLQHQRLRSFTERFEPMGSFQRTRQARIVLGEEPPGANHSAEFERLPGYARSLQESGL